MQSFTAGLSSDSVSGNSEYSDYDTIEHTYLNNSFSYDLNHPDVKYSLPESLEEISGLAYYRNNEILCVQDEKAKIYVYNLDEEDVVSDHDFGKDNDYEGISLVDQTVYVLRSDGRIFEVENFNTKNRTTKEYNTSLSKKNDTEGLTYDRVSNSLFIACKGSPSVEKDNPYKGFKAVYQFDLGEMNIDQKPYILVDLNSFESYRDAGMFTRFSLWVARALGLIESETSFHPSGIAIHPVRDEIYLISSQGKILVILDRQGKVLDLHELDPGIFRQPEGICFSPSGDLFIANEGKGGKGYILKFIPKNRE
ncbi:MAG: SdiA-regulated domain-containing protein [Bacteroidales bacterium]|nr:SdiA-regulated domain-containing protein [Bacteroidales bacterium]